MSIGVLDHAWQPRPVKPSAELPFVRKLEEGILHVRPQPGLLHSSLHRFEVDDHMPGLIIKAFMEFVHCTGEFLHILCKLRVHWDAGAEQAESADLSHHSWVVQPVQRLFSGKIEWNILGEYIEVAVVGIRSIHWRSRVGIQLSCELIGLGALRSHLIRHALMNPIPDVWALDDSSLVNSSVAQVTAFLIP